MANKRLTGHGIVAVPANGKQIFESKDFSKARERSSMVVSNLATVAQGYILYVTDTQGNEVFAVYPQDRQAFDTDDTFYVKNPNGVDVNCVVGEVNLPGGVSSLNLNQGGGGGGSSSGGDSTPAYSGGTRRPYLP